MTSTELFIADQIKKLVPTYDTIELRATVDSSAFSVEFFATVQGKRQQCFEMMDVGAFTEKEFNAAAKSIANYLRGLPDFDANAVNKYNMVLR